MCLGQLFHGGHLSENRLNWDDESKTREREVELNW